VRQIHAKISPASQWALRKVCADPRRRIWPQPRTEPCLSCGILRHTGCSSADARPLPASLLWAGLQVHQIRVQVREGVLSWKKYIFCKCVSSHFATCHWSWRSVQSSEQKSCYMRFEAFATLQIWNVNSGVGMSCSCWWLPTLWNISLPSSG
jgi:hypothetical protein